MTDTATGAVQVRAATVADLADISRIYDQYILDSPTQRFDEP